MITSVKIADTMRGDIMARKSYVCIACGFEFVTVPGEEEPPVCPVCESDETERLETATLGGIMEELDFTPGKSRFR